MKYNRISNLSVNKNATMVSNIFSIHTFEMRSYMDGNLYRLIKNRLFALCKYEGCKSYPDNRKIVKSETEHLHFELDHLYGRVEMVCFEINGGYSYFRMTIKVNPRLLFHRDRFPFLYIASGYDVDQALNRVDELVERLEETLLRGHIRLRLSRVDFCSNIDLGSHERAEEYLTLLKKGYCPPGCKRRMEYSVTGRRMVPTKNSFTIQRQNWELALYSKWKQMIESDKHYELEEVEKARGILRIELRCYPSKTSYELGKVEGKAVRDFFANCSEIGGKLITSQLIQCYGSGVFLSYQEAERMIRASKKKDKTKRKMIAFLQLVSRGGMDKAAKEVETSEIKNLMRHFNELGLSPITIPTRYESQRFLAPWQYILLRNANYPSEEIKINSEDLSICIEN